jgi:(p)ppGpp synthase/HD superfamily hydrolase
MKNFNPSEMDQEDIAKFIAYAAHRGQFRSDGVTPYITHPEAVANSFPENNVKERALAWLHDVLEDCPWLSPFALRKFGLDSEVVWAVNAMTHEKDVPYDEYIDDVIDYGPSVVKVKLADIRHNLSCDPTEVSKAKYAKALPKLENALLEYEKMGM